MRVKPSNSHWVFEQSAQRCILAFSKDTYCQFNRYWIFVELTVTVYNFKASVLPRSCCCPLAIRYTFPSKYYICYILWSVGQALFQICFHSLLVHCIIYLAAGDMTVKQLLLKTFKKKKKNLSSYEMNEIQQDTLESHLDWTVQAELFYV